jgi:hypothetical protein
MKRFNGGRPHAAVLSLATLQATIGLIALGFHVGSSSALVAQSALTSRLRGASVVPSAAAKPAAETTTTEAPQPPPAPPTVRGALPVGKGMWLYQPAAVEGGNPQAIVARAEAVGLTHLFVRTGSSSRGFYAADFLAKLLPVAHAHGIRIYGWDFPYFRNVGDDVNRGVAAIAFTTPDGHRIDGFSADVEFPSMGVKLTPANASAYGAGLRRAVGDNYPLIATVPRPSHKIKFYPYDDVVRSFDAIAPMVYWLNREPAGDVTGAIQNLAKYGKPVIPIGQAYDGAADHGPPGVPNRAAIQAFMEAADRTGATSVSFWSWQHASQEAWDAIKDSPYFVLPSQANGTPALSPGQLRAYQSLLTSLGFPTPVDGVGGQALIDAISAYQRAAHLPVTGVIDDATRKFLLKPFLSPLLGH